MQWGQYREKPSSQIMENSSESLNGASWGGRLVRSRLCYCDVWLWSCRETEGQRKRAMEWNKGQGERIYALNSHSGKGNTSTDDGDHGCRVSKVPQERVVEW